MTDPTEAIRKALETIDESDWTLAQFAPHIRALLDRLDSAERANAELIDKIGTAYGHLWHTNNEPLAPVPLRSIGEAAYEARKILRDTLTKEQRGEGINRVQAALRSVGEKEPK